MSSMPSYSVLVPGVVQRVDDHSSAEWKSGVEHTDDAGEVHTEPKASDGSVEIDASARGHSEHDQHLSTDRPGVVSLYYFILPLYFISSYSFDVLYTG